MNAAYVGRAVILLAVYALSGKLGLQFEAVSGFATIVWPPSGIALAMLLIFGYRYWPSVFLGAFLVNLGSGASSAVSLSIAAGNTLEAVVAVYMIKRAGGGFRNSLDRLPDVLNFIIFGAIISTMIAATIGATSLWAGGIISPQNYTDTWRAWWLGDMVGILILSPVLLRLSSFRKFSKPKRKTVIEIAVLAAFTALTALGIFHNIFQGLAEHPSIIYLIYLPLIWAALRFGQSGTAMANLGVDAIAIWGVVRGFGPFINGNLFSRLLLLQSFAAVTAGTTVLLAAAIEQLKYSEQEALGKKQEVQKLNTDLREKLNELIIQRKYTEDSHKALINLLASMHMERNLDLELRSRGEGFLVLDYQNKVIFGNKKAEIIIGAANADLLGRNIHNFIENQKSEDFGLARGESGAYNFVVTGSKNRNRVNITVIPIISEQNLLCSLLVLEKIT